MGARVKLFPESASLASNQTYASLACAIPVLKAPVEQATVLDVATADERGGERSDRAADHRVIQSRQARCRLAFVTLTDIGRRVRGITRSTTQTRSVGIGHSLLAYSMSHRDLSAGNARTCYARRTAMRHAIARRHKPLLGIVEAIARAFS